MTRLEVCRARIVRFVARQLQQLAGSGDEFDLTRLREIASQDLGGLTSAQKGEIARIAAFLQEQSKRLGFVHSIIEIANFDEPFAQKALARLAELSGVIDKGVGGGDLNPDSLLTVLNAYRKRLQSLWDEAHCVIAQPGMQRTTFTILLLSDFHWGADACENRWRDVQQPFFDALKSLSEKGHRIDLVVFSGDLANSGRWAEYDGAGRDDSRGFNGILRALWTHLQKNCGCDPLLLAVPGNHDLTWPSDPAEQNQVEVLKEYLRSAAIRRNVLEFRDSGERKVIENAFKDFLRWRECNLEIHSHPTASGKARPSS